VTVLAPGQVAAGVFKWAADEEVVDALYLAVRGVAVVAEARGGGGAGRGRQGRGQSGGLRVGIPTGRRGKVLGGQETFTWQ
jgi:hypothetical protein